MSYLNFTEIPNPGKKTKRWVVWSNVQLAIVKYHSPWRRYVVEFMPNIIIDSECLVELNDFLTTNKDARN